jgi:PAS domain S-box-containing protein
MSLRKRTFLSITFVLLAAIAVVYLTIWIHMGGEFDEFERTIVKRNTERTFRVLEDELDTLAGIAQDWGAWDDTYSFVQDENPEYVKKNLLPDALANLHLGFMGFLNTSHRLVESRMFDISKRTELPQSEDFKKWLRSVGDRPECLQKVTKGFVTSPQGVTLIATQPIVPSSAEGPARGTLVVGYLLTPGELKRIDRLTMLTTDLKGIESPSLSSCMQDAKKALRDAADFYSVPLDSQFIAGFKLLRDYQGKPCILLQVTLPRDARDFRNRAWVLLFVALFAVAVIITALAMVVLEKMVLARLLPLSRELSRIALRSDPSARVTVVGKQDELSKLANAVNDTLSALERSREDLRASEAVARALLDAPDNPAILLDTEGRILGLNRRAADSLRERDLQFMSGIDDDPEEEDVYHCHTELVRQAVEMRKPLMYEEEIEGRSIVHNLYPILNPSGEVAQVALFSRDVTDQKEAARALQESEQRYRGFVENAHGIVFRVRRDGTPVLCHGNVESISGVTEEEIIGGTVDWHSLIHPDDLESFNGFWNALLAQPDLSTQQRYRIRRKDGQLRWVEEFARSLAGPDGATQGVQGVVYDVTERVADEQALRESLQTTSDIVRAIPSGLLTFRYLGPDRFVLLDSNPEGERLTGFSLTHCRGREFKELWPGQGGRIALRLLNRVMRTGRVYETEGFQHRSGKSQWAFRVRAFPLPGDKLAVAFEDILERQKAETDRNRLEEQLHHSQKMEAIGQLAGGVAHDFNNLLGGILGYASLLRLEVGSNKAVMEAAQTIEQAAERAADLTRQLLGFARRGKFQNVVVNLHDTVKEVVHLLDRTLDKNIRIVQHLDAVSGNVMGDPNQLQQVFVNLALNARDAMPEGGELTFESSIVDRQGIAPEVFPDPKGRQFLLVSVRDQGCGIPKEHLDRVFEPFFTTKEQGKGTGMGLAMVYGIVKNHGGSVRVSSQLGVGTAFQVCLPLAPVTPQVDAAPAVVEKPVTGNAHILLVDDEAIIRNMGRTVLSRLGYSVTTVSGGQEALEYYREHSRAVDLVILDMVMPEMSGHDCFRALKCVNPDIRALLSSGYGFNGKASELLDEGMLGFIQKPYRVTELSVAVARALETQGV